MDNNNNFQQPMQGQPMNYGQPMPMQGQPMPMQGQPMQPAPKPPKQPMDPAKKKKIILISSLSAVAVVAVIALAILIPILLRVDYSTAYKTAKDLKEKVYDIYKSYDCEYVADYLTSTSVTSKKYAEYVDGCVEVYSGDVSSLVSKLGDTDGIKRNDDLKNLYEKFKAEFDKVVPSDINVLKDKLALWQAWHDFSVALVDLNYGKSSDADFTAAVNYLTNSGNETLKTYGEGWLERSLDLSAAYRAYTNASAGEWSTKYKEYTDKYNEFKDWVAANKPNVATLTSLDLESGYDMYSAFNTLYNAISETYEENYNSGSDDCTEFLGTVICS